MRGRPSARDNRMDTGTRAHMSKAEPPPRGTLEKKAGIHVVTDGETGSLGNTEEGIADPSCMRERRGHLSWVSESRRPPGRERGEGGTPGGSNSMCNRECEQTNHLERVSLMEFACHLLLPWRPQISD